MNKRLFVFLVVFICLLAAINGVSADNNSIAVDVNYEYTDDNYNPYFSIINGNDSIQFDKSYDSSLKEYKFVLNSSQIIKNSDFDVLVSAPGYEDEIQNIQVKGDGSLSLSKINFNLKASDSYKLGKDTTIKANSLLDFDKADDVLAVTTAGVPKLNNKTSEDYIEGITSASDNTITWGKGNILLLRQLATDPIVTCFITKKGNELNSAIFGQDSSNPIYLGTISDDMSRKQWNELVTLLDGDLAFSFASLANGWASGLSYEVLQEGAFHGHVCEGTLGGYSIVQTLLKYYPPKQETLTLAEASPGDISSYKILGVPGSSDDDAVLFFLDATPGKVSYFGFDTTDTGATDDMIGFIRWEDTVYDYDPVTNSYVIKTPGKGTLIVMQFDSKENQKLFKKETGIDSKEGSLEELKYQDWWINKIYTDPGHLVKILYELEGINEEQFCYFVGSTKGVNYPAMIKNATNAGKQIIPPIKSHGLDIAYIKELAKTLPKATRSNHGMGDGNLNYEDFKEIGKKASLMAKQIFKDELNVEIEKDDPNFLVLTSAGYVYYDGQTTEAVKDGINEVFGSTLTRQTLIPIHFALWKPLLFTYVYKENDYLWSVFIRYNPNGTYFVGTLDGKHVHDIGMNALNNGSLVKELSTHVIPDCWFNIESLAFSWSNEPSFDQLLGFIFHDHACPGVQPGFIINDYIQENYPLGENESYRFVATSVYCKDDSLIYLLGLSPGLGTYFDERVTNEEAKSDLIEGGSKEGVVIIWDDNLNIGKAAVINFGWPAVDLSKCRTREAAMNAQIRAFIDMSKGNDNPDIIKPYAIDASPSKWITAEQYKMLTSGGNNTNALIYFDNLPSLTKDQVLAAQNEANGTFVKGKEGGKVYHSTPSSPSSSPSHTSTGVSKYSSGTAGVGVSKLAEAIAPDTPADDASGEDKGKAYEISKDISSKKSTGIELVYALILVIILAVLIGYGYMRSRDKE